MVQRKQISVGVISLNDHGAVVFQALQIFLRKFVFVHFRVHRGRYHKWCGGRKRDTRQHIIGKTVRDFTDREEMLLKFRRDETIGRPDEMQNLDDFAVSRHGAARGEADGQPHVKEAEKLIHDCLKHARASLGSSKSLVDLGGEGQAVLSFLSHLNQIGQTGSTPRHAKGLSTCCHGEEPHTVGWRFINERRAISLDPNCGWARGKADVLYVADAFAVMGKVNELLAAGK